MRVDAASTDGEFRTPRLGPAAIFLRFLGFGCIAFGGPVTQIAWLRERFVERDRWVSPERFRRTLAMYQALPGPEAHEMCCWFGMIAGGRAGAIAAGLGFMLPGFALMMLASWAYLRWGVEGGAAGAAFMGAQAAVAGLVLRAAWKLVGTLVTGPRGWIIAGLGFVAAVAWNAAAPGPSAPEAAAAATSADPLRIFQTGLVGGLITFGGAYTAIPVVEGLAAGPGGWMTRPQFLDGVAIAGVLPAPLVIFATFVGYLGGGPLGAVLATAGMFLPAFAFTLFGHATIERLLAKPGLHAVLDGVAAAVAGMIAATALVIIVEVCGVRSGGSIAWPAPLPAAIAAVAFLAALRIKSGWTMPATIVVAATVGATLG